MKLRRIFAAIAACAVAATMAISASADISYTGDKVPAPTYNTQYGTYNWQVDIDTATQISDIAKATSIVFTVSVDAELEKSESGVIGAIGYSSDDNSWTSAEFGLSADNEKPITAAKVSDGVYTITATPADLKLDQFAKADGTYTWMNFQIQLYGAVEGTTNNQFKVTDITFAAAPAAGDEDKPADSTADSTNDKPADSTTDSTKPADDNTSKNPGTGATAGLALAGLAIAGAAVVAAKKSK